MAQWNPNYYPYFYRDIWPILTRPNQYGALLDFDSFAGGDPHNTTRGTGGNFDETVLSTPPVDGVDPGKRARMFIWQVLRKPGQENIWNYSINPEDPKYLPILMPFLCGDNALSNTVPSKFLRLTETQLFILGQWAKGNFVNETLEGLSTTQPEPAALSGTDLDRGVLSNMLGGSFCPGGETAWIIRNPAIYAEPYRLKPSSYFTPKNLQSWNPQPLSLPGGLESPDDAGSLKVGLEPGDLTKYGGIPWQADFNECSLQPIDITYEKWNEIYPQSTGDPVKDTLQTTYWWPTHRPMEVTDANLGAMNWSQGIPNNNAGDLKMVSAWKELGFISDIGQKVPGTYVQNERNDQNI